MRMPTKQEVDAKNTVLKIQFAGDVVPGVKEQDVNGVPFHHADPLFLGMDWSLEIYPKNQYALILS